MGRQDWLWSKGMATNTTNHDEIRRWAEARNGKPAAVKRTHQGGDVGIIRIMFPDNPQSSHDSLVEISWDEFFQQFEESKLALLYEEDSLFSKIVGRDTLERREHGEHASRHHSRGADDSQEGGSHSSQVKGNTGSGKHSSGGSADDDLKSREYRDEQGNIHHHTKAYQEQHGHKK
jgi:hypothetical protein